MTIAMRNPFHESATAAMSSPAGTVYFRTSLVNAPLMPSERPSRAFMALNMNRTADTKNSRTMLSPLPLENTDIAMGNASVANRSAETRPMFLSNISFPRT